LCRKTICLGGLWKMQWEHKVKDEVKDCPEGKYEIGYVDNAPLSKNSHITYH